jgi:HK97 gp10 family phage protein
MAEEFKIVGLDELERALEALGKKGTAAVRAAVRVGATEVKNQMVSLAPKDTGLLAKHFDIKTKKQRGEDLAVTAFVGPNGKEVIHPQAKGKTKGLPRTARMLSWFLEFGTSRESKKPFLTQAFETSKAKALEKIIETLREKLDLK